MHASLSVSLTRKSVGTSRMSPEHGRVLCRIANAAEKCRPTRQPGPPDQGACLARSTRRPPESAVAGVSPSLAWCRLLGVGPSVGGARTGGRASPGQSSPALGRLWPQCAPIPVPAVSVCASLLAVLLTWAWHTPPTRPWPCSVVTRSDPSPAPPGPSRKGSVNLRHSSALAVLNGYWMHGSLQQVLHDMLPSVERQLPLRTHNRQNAPAVGRCTGFAGRQRKARHVMG